MNTATYTAAREADADAPVQANSTARVAVASLIGTAIEFYDFYIYATAAALVIGPVFFPQTSGTAQALSAFITFGIAFLARPLGSALFGHFGDRIGRKSTLVASLLLMGLSTTLIGLLPGYDAIGAWAPILLCVLRFGQGLGLGGEWGGAALLVIVGLYVRLKLHETPVFAKALQQHDRARLPIAEMFSRHWRNVVLGSLAMVVCYALFYISAVFSLSYGVSSLGFTREEFLGLLCFAVLFMGAATPVSALACDRFGRRPVLIVGCLAAVASGFTMQPLLSSGSVVDVAIFLSLELFLMGVTFAPMGALLPELFPTRVRYTGASAAYNLGGILGASLAPYVAQKLVAAGGLGWVGGYVSVAAGMSLLAVLLMRETRETDL